MAAACTVCSHPDRTRIDAAIVGGTAAVTVAELHGVGRDAVRRHTQGHLTPTVRAQITKRETAGAATGVARLERLYRMAEELLTQAKEAGDSRAQLEAMKRAESIVTILMKASGELDERAQVNVLNVATDPSWVLTRSAMLGALQGFPEAGAAVAAALAGLEQ